MLLKNRKSPTGSRHGDRATDDHFSPGESHRFHEAVHVSRNQHHDQEAGEEESGHLQLHESAESGDMDVHHPVVHGRFRGDVPGVALLASRVALRGHIERPQRLQRLFALQQHVVLARRHHATVL